MFTPEFFKAVRNACGTFVCSSRRSNWASESTIEVIAAEWKFQLLAGLKSK